MSSARFAALAPPTPLTPPLTFQPNGPQRSTWLTPSPPGPSTPRARTTPRDYIYDASSGSDGETSNASAGWRSYGARVGENELEGRRYRVDGRSSGQRRASGDEEISDASDEGSEVESRPRSRPLSRSPRSGKTPNGRSTPSRREAVTPRTTPPSSSTPLRQLLVDPPDPDPDSNSPQSSLTATSASPSGSGSGSGTSPSSALSIDDIIRKHSPEVIGASRDAARRAQRAHAREDGAMEAAKQRARAEMGLDPEPDEGAGRPIPRTPVSPPKSRRRGGTISPRAAREGRRAVAETHTGTETETGTGTETGSDSAAADIRREVRAVTPGLRDRGECPSPSGLDTESRQIAVYLRSPHLNTILHIPVLRSSPSFPSLRVSLAQVGSPTGHPVLVFLGLGCVRYLIALFDELASAFGLRLICIDRWGFGKTGMIDQSERDPMAWVDIVDEVLRELGVEGYHLLAHSAGTPYAMALAKRFPERVRGGVHLLAPWVSADIDGGYKWLKWVPNRVIKTAIAADWHLQSYFLGKAPSITHKPVENVVERTPTPTPTSESTPSRSRQSAEKEMRNSNSPKSPAPTLVGSPKPAKRTPSLIKRASRIMRPSSSRGGSLPAIPTISAPINLSPLRASSSSILGSNDAPPDLSTKDLLRGNHSYEVPDFGPGEGFDAFPLDLKYALPLTPSSIPFIQHSQRSSTSSPLRPTTPSVLSGTSTSTRSSTSTPTGYPSTPPMGPAFMLALSQASHAESEPGTTADLLSIVLGRRDRDRDRDPNRRSDRKPLGSTPADMYEDVPHRCKVWYGTEDDKVSEKSMRWLEAKLDAEVEMVRGEGHNLMTAPGSCVRCLRVWRGREGRGGMGRGGSICGVGGDVVGVGAGDGMREAVSDWGSRGEAIR
ncbi:hypothetical protein EHS25_006633 [Saitozyma podzolica]|uniref:AB hydrolase-1 domain-containing protein n=1 Tax=Saitozyma podzolica TaxID=1890683 RepID=A0A427YSA9_9TREE|nr:hypothetical protein EHS25_006633 [Saitozyma podzolica]